MYLLDTNSCITFIYGGFADKLSAMDNFELATSLIVYGELMFGVAKSELFYENLERIENFLQIITVLDLDSETAHIYGKLKANILKLFGPKDKAKLRNFKAESLGFKDNDLWIASTAIQNKMILVSSDSDMMRLHNIAELKVENWS